MRICAYRAFPSYGVVEDVSHARSSQTNSAWLIFTALSHSLQPFSDYLNALVEFGFRYVDFREDLLGSAVCIGWGGGVPPSISALSCSFSSELIVQD